ncbi:MAG: SusF/SusE family outer membrane protein [Chlorobi bacterium]|nr:SusF/SusE family outer membrane protein [Chlorobiota bacterium]
MKNKILIFISIIGLTALFSSCEKDGTQIVMSKDVIAPEIISLPDLTLVRGNSSDTVEFVGKSVDPGFDASAKYFLEAAKAGTDFENVVQLYSGNQIKSVKMTVGELNTMLLDVLPEDQMSAADYRIRCDLVVDGGTGAAGTGNKPFEYISDPVESNTTVFGLLRLDLINSGIAQKITSPQSDGEYSGFVKLNVANPFTLKDPDNNVEYGGSGGNLVVNGAAIVPGADGWHKLTVNTTDLTYDLQPYMIGLVGSATPNGWNSPDQKMDYDVATKTWNITLDLVDGEVKFRLNDGWAWNLGQTDAYDNNLVADGHNISVTAGNYTVTLKVTDYDGKIATFTMVKNN